MTANRRFGEATSVWLDDETRKALEKLVKRSGGRSRSELIRELIIAQSKIDGGREARLRKLVDEMHGLVI